MEHVPYVRSIKFLIRPPFTPLRGEDDEQLTVEDIYSKFGAVDYHLTIFNQRTHQQVKHNLRHWDAVNPISDELEKDLSLHRMGEISDMQGKVLRSLTLRTTGTSRFFLKFWGKKGLSKSIV